MAERFRNKYRIETTRMKNWDYAWSGWYFITINTYGRELYFGRIENKRMVLSEIGEIANSEWLKSAGIRPDMNIELDEFVIMPDHIHAIIHIGRNEYNRFGMDKMIRSVDRRVATYNFSAAQMKERSTEQVKNRFGPQRKNLSSIIRGYKSVVTTHARMLNIDFAWQPGFYDRLIRDNNSLDPTRRYIKENPKNWIGDGP
jgi:putative transposase